MVKSLIAIAVALALFCGIALFEGIYVDKQFDEFQAELYTLYEKTDEEKANCEDAKTVQARWENKKSKLHVWIPHNDIARIDDYLAETVRLIAEKDFSHALSKLEILLHACKTIPGTYRPNFENIF